ncbi:hypothetical protein BU15DRAFT_79383 [Melanogaster broomeanus]|nr:hypothetical protein BU15DRAFT_79383 [Melanogaster broomeanus]
MPASGFKANQFRSQELFNHHSTLSLMEIGGLHGKPYREYAGDCRDPERARSDISYGDKKDTDPIASRFGGIVSSFGSSLPGLTLYAARLLPLHYGSGATRHPWTQVSERDFIRQLQKFTPVRKTRGTFDYVYNCALDPTGVNGVLAPYRHADGSPWTSDETRFLTTDANTYPKRNISPLMPSSCGLTGLNVDIAASSTKERRTARARIARYYGIDPEQSRETVRVPSWALLPVPRADDVHAGLPEKFMPLSGYRHSVVLVRLQRRKLRRASGSMVRGIVYLPPLILYAVLGDCIRSDENAVARAGALIAMSLSGTLVDAVGTVLASAQGGEFSALACRGHAATYNEDAVELVYFFDCARHNDPLPSG